MLWARVAAGAELTPATVAAAEEIAGVHFEPAERELLLDGLKRQEQQLDALHALPLDNAVAAAVPRDADLAFLGAGPTATRSSTRTPKSSAASTPPARCSSPSSH